MTRSIETVIRSNPYWTEEANRAAEANPEELTGRDLARRFADHRIEQPGIDTAKIYVLPDPS